MVRCRNLSTVRVINRDSVMPISPYISVSIDLYLVKRWTRDKTLTCSVNSLDTELNE